MSRDDATLLDLVHHARLLIELIDGYDRARFLSDVRTQLSDLDMLVLFEPDAQIGFLELAALQDALADAVN